VKKFCTFVALVALLAFQATTNAATMEERIAAAGAAMALDSADKPAESSPQAEASLSWDMTRAKAVPYAVVQAQKEHRAAIGRTKLLLRIVPVAKGKDGKLQPLHGQNKLTKEQLAATAAAAAKYHAQLTGAQMVSVALQTQFFPNHGAARLATVDYAPQLALAHVLSRRSRPHRCGAEDGKTRRALSAHGASPGRTGRCRARQCPAEVACNSGFCAWQKTVSD